MSEPVVDNYHFPCLPTALGLDLHLQSDTWWPHLCSQREKGMPAWPYRQTPRPVSGTFCSFGRLPAELRIQIWEYVFDEPCLWQYRFSAKKHASKHALVPVGIVRPALAGSSCIEAREIMKQRYTPVRNMNGRGTCWMDPEKTVIDLSNSSIHHFIEAMDRKDLSLLHHIVIFLGHLNELFNPLMDGSLGGVSTIILEKSKTENKCIGRPSCTVHAGLLVNLAKSDHDKGVVKEPLESYETELRRTQWGREDDTNSYSAKCSVNGKRSVQMKWLTSVPTDVAREEFEYLLRRRLEQQKIEAAVPRRFGLRYDVATRSLHYIYVQG